MKKHFCSLGKEPKKNHLMMLLHPINYKWNVIGKHLHVNVKYNVAHNDTTKLSEVLQVWIDKRTCEVSGRKIISVVKEPTIEDKAIADNIYQFLSRPDIQNEYLSSHQSGKFKYGIITL